MNAEQMAVFGEYEAMLEESKAERFRRKADEWAEANKTAWEFMKQQARMSASKGKRFGMKSLAEHTRWHLLAQGVDEYKVNNSYVSALARKLVDECPECRPYIEMRHSVLDQ